MNELTSIHYSAPMSTSTANSFYIFTLSVQLFKSKTPLYNEHFYVLKLIDIYHGSINFALHL
jgi:hypothetical protein